MDILYAIMTGKKCSLIDYINRKTTSNLLKTNRNKTTPIWATTKHPLPFKIAILVYMILNGKGLSLVVVYIGAVFFRSILTGQSNSCVCFLVFFKIKHFCSCFRYFLFICFVVSVYHS